LVALGCSWLLLNNTRVTWLLLVALVCSFLLFGQYSCRLFALVCCWTILVAIKRYTSHMVAIGGYWSPLVALGYYWLLLEVGVSSKVYAGVS
jgi:hypothetical protein